MNRPLKPRPRAAKKPTREVLAAALAEKERALAEALARQAATAEVLRVISRSSADAQPVFESIALAAMRLLHCDVAGLFGCDESAYWTIAGANPEGLITLPGPSRVRIDPAATFPSRAIVSKQVLHLPDWSRVELPDVERRVQEQAGLNSTLYLPMLREERCVGVLVFGSTQPNNFGPGEIALAESFRDQASIAIENARLFNEAKAKTRDLEESLQQQTATADVLKVISRSVFDLQTVLDTLVESAYQLCGARMGLLYLAGEGAFECKAIAGAGVAEAEALFKGRPIRAGRGTAAERVIQTGEVESIEDFYADPDFSPRILAALQAGATVGSPIGAFRSTLGAPMKRDDAVIGVIAIVRAETGPFPQRQVELLQTFADQAVIAIENARLFNEVQAKTHDLEASLAQQTATADVLRIISRSVSDAAPVFETILESCERLFGLHGVAIYLVEGDMVRGVARRGFDLGEWGSDIMPLAGSSTGEALAGRRPLHIPDLAEKPDFPEEKKAALKEIGGMSVLYAPMLSQDRGVGSIVVTRRPKKPFTEAEIEFIQTFADQAVIAIENARLLEEVRARTSDLEESLAQQTATADVLKVISRSAFDLQPVLDTLIRSAVELVGSAHGSIHIREGDVFPQKSNFGFTPELSSRVRQAPPLPGRGTLTGRVALSGKVEAIPDVLEDAEFTAPWKGVILVRSMLGVPLLRNDRVEGVLILARVEPGAFTPRQIELVQTFADQAEIAIENARLFEEVQAKTRDLSEALVYQTGSSNILKVIAASPTNVAPVLKAIVDSACEVCDAYDAAVVLKDGGDLRFSAHRGPIPIGLDKWPINRQWVGGRAFVDRQPVHVHDLTLAGEEFPDGRELARRMGHRTILAVPLVREGESIGAIIVRRNEAHSFTDKQIALLQTFADQAVIAIGNVRLFDEVQAKTRELSDSLEQQTAAAEILRVISSSPTDVQPVFEAIARSAAELCDATNSGVFLVRDGLIHLAGHHNLSDAQLASAQHAFPAPLGRGIVSGRAILSRAVVHIPDIAADSEYSAESVVSAGFRCALSVPMLRNGEPIGAINVTRMEPRPFSNQQVELLKTFADQAVIAISNVGLFNETQEALQQQTATADVLKVISRSAFGLQTVLQTLVDSAVRLCAADGVIYLKHGEEFIAEAAFAADASGLARKRMPRRVGRDSVTGRVALSGQIEQIPDNLADPDFTVPADQRMRMRSLLGVPLLRDGEVEGVFVLGRPEPGPFSERAIELVRTFADQAVIAIQNVRLFDAVQAKTRDLEDSLQQQTATADVLKVISRSAFDLQAVFDTLIASAVELCGAFSGIICVREGDIFRYRGAAGEGDSAALTRYLLEHPATPGRGSLAGRVLLSGKVEAIPDRLEDPEFAVPMDAYGQVARSLLGVPLLGKAGIEGALLLTRKQPGRFTDRQVEIVQTFADQAVIAIENARLFDEVQARTRDLSEALQQQTATADVLKVISRSAFDLQTVLDTLVASAATLCEAEKACIFQRRGDLYHWVSNFGFSDELVAYAGSHPFREGGNSATSRVARDRRTVHVPDVLADPEYTASEYQRLGGYRTMLGVPLLREGAPIGVFIMTREAVRPFNDRQIELLQTFADQAVIAIENVRLFDEVQARTRELSISLERQTATSEILRVISQSPTDARPVFESIVLTAARLLHCDLAFMMLTDGNIWWNAAVASPEGLLPVLVAGKFHVDAAASFPARAILDKAMLYLPDWSLIEVPEHQRRVQATYGVNASLHLPLMREGDCIGLLTLATQRINPFGSSEIDQAESFRDQALIAMENARLFDEVQTRTRELAASLDDLRKTQDRLVQSEKLASLGQLTAGIAHEIKNPLNFINNFSGLSHELLVELGDALKTAPLEASLREEVDDLIATVAGNLDKVVSHGKRADSIVKNMLLHSREGSGERSSVNVNAMVEEALNLAYHGARAEKPGFNVTIAKSLDPGAGAAELYAQEMTRVLLNLISNGFYATTKRRQGGAESAYEPTISASTRDLGDSVEIAIRDNGTGIPENVKAKMFNPFFTTKPAGEGTGLGLSLSHDIVVKQHGGTLEVSTEPGAFTQFTIVVPRAVGATS